MTRITHVQEKKHDEALAILSLSRPLTDEQIEFVFEHYSPLATHRVSKGAIFFTPLGLADDLSVFAQFDGPGSVIDLCAGIGILTHTMMQRHMLDSAKDRKRFVCVETDDEFVQVGKKLLPDAEWLRGDVFDLGFIASLGTFTMGISNPPYGQVPSAKGKSALKAKVPAHLSVAELILRMCERGGFLVMPRADQAILNNRAGERRYEISSTYQRWKDAFPGAYISMTHDPEGMYQFVGANPDVVVADVDIDQALCDLELPLGFADVLKCPVTANVVSPKLQAVPATPSRRTPSQPALFPVTAE